MSAIVCGKRSFFEDLQSPSPTSPSTPVSKKLRCSSTSPRRFSPTVAVEAAAVDQLRALFPDIDSQLLEKALEECGNDLDAAVKKLHELHLSHGEGKSVTEADGEMNDGKKNTASVLNNLPVDGAEWVELFVREMMSATSTDDARTRATRVLGSLEKSISDGARAAAAQNFQKVSGSIPSNSQQRQTLGVFFPFVLALVDRVTWYRVPDTGGRWQENLMLKEQIEMIFRDNTILKRAVAIQHERQKEFNDKNQEVHQLKQLLVQYQEQLRTLEVNNYSLKMHLQQAHQCNSIPGHFHPDVF
ncbi:putative mitogen-activated protein kinase kinase kinase 12-like [Capsicum annuum]|nr:putative mitogen-activated protein kinase kinase kinase 12-like [Capsicum annuum]